MRSPSDRILLRLNTARIDADLAAGLPSETSPRHAARARQLVNPRKRHTLAANWDHMLAISHTRAPGLSGRVPICRQRVHQAEPEIRELIAALRAAGPMPVRGVAMALDLLTDGRGPIFNPNPADDLIAAVDQAVAELDPSLPLTSDLTASARDWPTAGL
jgi:hypothetical protein